MKLKTYTQRCVTLTKRNPRMDKITTKNSQNQYMGTIIPPLQHNFTLKEKDSIFHYKDIKFSSSESDIVNK